MKIKKIKPGFTLVELLVVVAVIGILIGMLFPAVQAVRQAARKTSCNNNIRQIIIASQNYETSNARFPMAAQEDGRSLFVELSGFLDQEYIYQRSLQELSKAETIKDRLTELSSLPMDVLFCPATPELNRIANISGQGKYTANYYAMSGPLGFAVSTDGSRTYKYTELDPEPTGGAVGLDGLFSPHVDGTFTAKRGAKDIRDGVTNTIAFGEISYSPIRNGSPAAERAGWAFGATYDASDLIEKIYSSKSFDYGINHVNQGDTNNLSYGSVHGGGAHFAFADGSIKFINERVNLDVLKTLCSIKHLEIPEEFGD